MELEEIRRMRKRLELTQKELAKLAGVSQSLIAKVESGKMDPTYSKAKKIFSVLESIKSRHEEKAGMFTTKKVIFTRKNERITDAAKKMKKNSISQMPVLEKGKVVGMVSETGILEMISKGKDISELKSEDVMEDAPPAISKNTPKEAIISLLRYTPIVLVHENGKCTGVITKADLLKRL